jgi:hypothetical protein
MSKNLWIPTTDSDGVPVEALRVIIQQLNEWREQYLPRVGVPTDFAAEWDFVSAVSACASDATFHIMWIILFNALDDRGIRESLGSPNSASSAVGTSTALGSGSGLQQEIEELKTKVLDEALHGAMRIAGLVRSRSSSITSSMSNPIPYFTQAGVLTKNGYLRLDPAVMHVSCNYAGILLARFGRPEVQNCIEGLEQYSCSYEEAAEQAQELRRLFALARAGQTDFVHMTSAVTRQQQHPHPHHHHHHHHHHSPPQQQRPQPQTTQAPSQGAQSEIGNGMYVDGPTF